MSPVLPYPSLYGKPFYPTGMEHNPIPLSEEHENMLALFETHVAAELARGLDTAMANEPHLHKRSHRPANCPISGGEAVMNEYRASRRGRLWALGFCVFICACSSSTSEDAARASVVQALDGFAEELEEEPPINADSLYSRLQAYLEAHPDFYGSAVALLDTEGIVTASPYVYRSGEGFAELDLATPDYHIDEQEWLATPRDSKEAMWTDPYFDAGGGEIWMVTRSVTVIRDGAVVLVVTTDLPVDAPTD
jgi:hypothetical protein